MSKKYVLAVSGGVDSVVLLDMVASPHSTFHIPHSTFIVAHFDHGIRQDSAADAEFVRDLATQYGLDFESKREELGVNASEELARDRRYTFLRAVAKKYEAKIMTAHHGDDVVETVAINISRGTGWRGLAVMDSSDIERPLLSMRKAKIIEYAKQHQLQWHEDSTNVDTKYLRNDIRIRLGDMSDEDFRLIHLYRARQVALKRQIEAEVVNILQDDTYNRYFFTTIPDAAAIELLRRVFIQATGVSPTIPQRSKALHAIKTYQPGKRYEVANGMTLQFTKTTFVVEVTPRVLS